MIPTTSWTPSWKWHLKTAGLCLLACSIGWLAGWYITQRLSAPYQPYRPAIEELNEP
ncbi:MAG: hypothetical protein IKP96_06565 [Elusimicrobiaceae bacterium]|nr:hypothetical protein [Elusimicrobiaceae bacterium]